MLVRWLKVSDIDVKFVNEKSDTLAEVRYVFNEKGITNRLVLNINMKNYNKMNLKDVSGYAGGYMLQRYFAKQVSDSFVWEIEFDNCKLNPTKSHYRGDNIKKQDCIDKQSC